MCRLVVMYHQPEDPKKWEEHYYNVHIPLVAKMPKVKKLSVSKSGLNEMERENPYHLIAEMEWESKEAMKAAFQTPDRIRSHDDFISFAEGKVTTVGYEVQEYEPGTGKEK